MSTDHDTDRTLSRRDVFRLGGLATAAGAVGGLATPEAAAAAPGPAKGAQVYTRIGVRPFINLTGTLTINGGALTLPEVRDASHEAADHAVDIDELMEKAGARIAEVTGSEAAIVTSGAAAALSHATAACIAGTDPELMQQLPDLTGLRDEVIMPRESRNVYDHAFRSWGARIIEIDSVESLRAALGPRTALVAVLGSAEARGVRLEAIAEAAHKAGVPVVVDAAAELPRKPDPYLARGADLVAYSGGKAMRGPQCAGLLLGRKDLVWAAFMNGAPHHAVGRMMKVGKEEIMGMVAAVEVLMSRGTDGDFKTWRAWLTDISDIVTKVPGVRAEMQEPGGTSPYPTMNIEWDPQQVGITAGEVYDRLLAGEPRVMSHASGDGYSFRVRPPAMKAGDQILAGRQIAAVLRQAPKGIAAKTLSAPAADLAGRWDVEVQYSRGHARHSLLLVTSGNAIEGSHVGRRLHGAVRGEIDGDRVRLRSSLPCEGTRLSYRFEGRLAGETIAGEVDLGEYGKARWTARRQG
ncbi:MAG TPA: aminotransferase class V-fold PLP-dependent enzyme [Vicinamibacterales bacterium]|jgi:L-seryl-tRNA(Ser) seleniumtransferase|nr:aminotransferase class V-fold PLP-dependent enzyme [Vicinamibacterales bacterium]